MIKPPARIWGTLLAVLALLVAGPSGAAPRIVAIGDLHGDWSAWRALAEAAGISDREGRWTGGDTILVQTGDIPDRGPDSARIMRDLMRLQRQAPRTGGRVIALVGNHEAMNVTGDLRYVHPGEYAAFVDSRSERRRRHFWRENRAEIAVLYRQADPSLDEEAVRRAWVADTPLGMIEHRLAWSPRGELGRWVVSNPSVVVLDGIVFVHAGIGAAYAHLPAEEINRRVADALERRAREREAIVNDPSGPLWYRGLILRDGGTQTRAPEGLTMEAELALALDTHGARAMVVGHTVSPEGIAFRQGGRLVQIDTGNSAAYGGPRSWLEIRDGRMIPHRVDGGGRGE